MRVHLVNIATIAFCAISLACGSGGGDTPTSPSRPTAPSIPAASIQLDGNLDLTTCVRRGSTNIACDFQETGKNAGPGCATNVRGTVRFLSGETETAVERWTLGSDRVLMPNEQFTYTVTVVALPESFTGITGYRRDATMWANTPC